MSRNHAKAYAKEYGKAALKAVDDTITYMTPDVIRDTAYAIWRWVKKDYPSKEETDKYDKESRESVRKWFKMMKDWAKSAAKKVKDYIKWDSSSAVSAVRHMKARAKFKWKK